MKKNKIKNLAFRYRTCILNTDIFIFESKNIQTPDPEILQTPVLDIIGEEKNIVTRKGKRYIIKIRTHSMFGWLISAN